MLCGARGHPSPPWSGAFAYAEETRFARAHERREARLDGHAFILARDCRAVLHAVLLLGRRADEPRGPTRLGQLVMLRAGLVVRARATPRARSTRSRRALPSSLSMPAARDIHTFARRASTMAHTVSARVPLRRAVGRDQMPNISRPGHADPTRW